MTGLNGKRVYLDWNATAPLRPEARAAMLEAMDVVGNPSSVHTEGRAARKIIEKAREQVAALVGCEPSEVVFTSGATEAAATLYSTGTCRGANEMDHDCLVAWAYDISAPYFDYGEIESHWDCHFVHEVDIGAQSLADGETGIMAEDYFAVQAGTLSRAPLPEVAPHLVHRIFHFADMTQLVGKFGQAWVLANLVAEFDAAIASGHKIGGPSGCGCIILPNDTPLEPLLKGGGQERGKRSGTENVLGIAGFGAAAQAALGETEDGTWLRVETLRNALEERVAEAAPDTIFFGRESPRLPNTSCYAVPGWAGETQVMQMDLAGFAVSAGSACSSGKVNKASRVLLAMGFDEITASSAIRVSMGPTTTEAEVMAFADAWIEAYRRRKSRAA